MSDEEINCFVAHCKCGAGLIFAAVDTIERRKENGKEVAKLIAKGYRIENKPLGEVRRSKFCWECETKPTRKARADPQRAIF